jgi:hypothetical protein
MVRILAHPQPLIGHRQKGKRIEHGEGPKGQGARIKAKWTGGEGTLTEIHKGKLVKGGFYRALFKIIFNSAFFP